MVAICTALMIVALLCVALMRMARAHFADRHSRETKTDSLGRQVR